MNRKYRRSLIVGGCLLCLLTGCAGNQNSNYEQGALDLENKEYESNIKTLQAQISRESQKLQIGQSAFHREQSRLESLKNITERYDGYGNSIRKVMDNKDREKGLLGVVADIVKVEKDYEIAIETAKTAKIFGIDPKVAMLSYSTYGSGKGEMVTLMANATKKVKEMAPDLDIDGELQFDAAVAPEVAKVKCAGSTVAGQANTFIFPEISAGNIGYKIAARLGEYEAIGPVLQGLNAPINDLSRGCNAQEVYKMALVTAALS